MRMVKFHHRASGVITPEAQLAGLMGSTQYVIWADDLGADASAVSSWGPFSAVASPVVDADGYLGSLKTLNFNGSSQYLLHGTTNLIANGGTHTIVAAFTLPDVTSASVRSILGFGSSASATEQHGIEFAAGPGSVDTYIRNNGNTSLAHSLQRDVPCILVVSRTTTHTRVKMYQSSSTSTYKDVAQASLTLGSSVQHRLMCRPAQALGFMAGRLRFAALSVNQGALDESGMDALASFLQSGPYNCPLS